MLPLIEERRRERRRMAGGIQRRKILLGLLLVMVLGVAVYFRLWTIDYSLSSDDTELLRRQFDLANREAMDESAEWRRKFDEEAVKVLECEKELNRIKESMGKDDESSINQKLELLQKENMALHRQVETLQQELKAAKLNCHS